MTAHRAACNAIVVADSVRYRLANAFSYLCMSCWDTVARSGREPRELLEAILLFNNVLDIGGPDDPLDHEDCRDLEWLGLLSDSPGSF